MPGNSIQEGRGTASSGVSTPTTFGWARARDTSTRFIRAWA
jgi:hypothetical protein